MAAEVKEVFINANRVHYETAAAALIRADQDWLRRLITRRVRLDRWKEAFERRVDDIKVVLDFSDLWIEDPAIIRVLPAADDTPFSDAHISLYTPKRVRVEAKANGPAVLMLND